MCIYLCSPGATCEKQQCVKNEIAGQMRMKKDRLNKFQISRSGFRNGAESLTMYVQLIDQFK